MLVTRPQSCLGSSQQVVPWVGGPQHLRPTDDHSKGTMTTRALRPLVGLALAAATLVLIAPATEASADAEYGEAQILWLVNVERHQRGLPPVSRHGGADSIAQFSADVQAWNGRLGHNPNLGKDVTKNAGPWWFVGENVGCAADGVHMHQLWMGSPGHAANILRPEIDTVGIGAIYARGCLWATVVYADLR